MQMHKKYKNRPKTSCLFYHGRPGIKKNSSNCTLTTYATCEPDTCPWYKSQEMMDASYEKARKNYIKSHGRDDYDKLGFGPKRRMLPRKEESDIV